MSLQMSLFISEEWNASPHEQFLPCNAKTDNVATKVRKGKNRVALLPHWNQRTDRKYQFLTSLLWT